jgi:hypothetical protein
MPTARGGEAIFFLLGAMSESYFIFWHTFNHEKCAMSGKTSEVDQPFAIVHCMNVNLFLQPTKLGGVGDVKLFRIQNGCYFCCALSC